MTSHRYEFDSEKWYLIIKKWIKLGLFASIGILVASLLNLTLRIVHEYTQINSIVYFALCTILLVLMVALAVLMLISIIKLRLLKKSIEQLEDNDDQAMVEENDIKD